MTEYDITDVEYPNKQADYPAGKRRSDPMPRDVGETFDLVVRKAPISHSGIMRQVSAYSSDTVFEHLQWLDRHNYVDRIAGDLEKHGTTEDVYVVSEKRIGNDSKGVGND